jgi:diguanylate cyclase (GGDEF)-like protein/PAS domain S-box-containing protein
MPDNRSPNQPSAPLGDDFHKSIADNVADGVYFVDPSRRILYWNRGAERLTGYAASRVVGHQCFENILDHVDDAGRALCHTTCPLAATMSDGEARETTVWMRHSDGYRKPVRISTTQVRDAEGRVIGGVETFSDGAAVLHAMAEADRARRDALTDELTGLPNRRLFDVSLSGRLENLVRYGWTFGLLIVDVDDFKDVNDNFGHAFGDASLRGVAATLAGGIRGGDMVARWGGDEFAVIVESPNHAGLTETAERLRVLTARSETRFSGATHRVHISIGGALALKEDTPETLFARADAALYKAKHAGRNRVELTA